MNKKLKLNLESKILDRVYKFELSRTIFAVIRYVLISVGAAALIFATLSQIASIFGDQKTLDLLELFLEDREIIQSYFLEVIDVISEETPWDLIIFLLLAATALGMTLFFISKNARKIKNRASRLLSYFK